jgi:acyl-lipid omega-6 desaturase (Delta-12 desaturase)
MSPNTYQSIGKKLDFTKSERHLAHHLLVNAALAVAIFLSRSGPFFLVSQALLPVLMFRAFALMHECIHHSATKNRLLNDAVGIVAGALCLLPYEPWKQIHLAHHKWTGNVEQDPSMGLIRKFPFHTKFKNRLFNACWKAWIPVLALAQHFVFWTKSYQFLLNAKSRPERVRNALSVGLPLALYTQIPWSENIVGLALYLAMVEIVNFPHHLRMPMLRENEHFPYREQHLTARSCAYPRWISHHVLNNFNLHVEHHLFPALPWHRLPEARELIKPVLGAAYTEIEGNGWILENREKRIEDVFSTNFHQQTSKAA